MRKRTESRANGEERGLVLVISLIVILILLGYGLVVIKQARFLTKKAELNLLVVSALNFAANSARNPDDMLRGACYGLLDKFDIESGASCSSRSFPPGVGNNPERVVTLDNVETHRGELECKIEFTYTPETAEDVPNLCIELTDCVDQYQIIPPLLSPALYTNGASGCIGSRVTLAYLLVDHSSSVVKIFDPNGAGTGAPLELPPSFLVLPAAGYNKLDTNDAADLSMQAQIMRQQLPGIFDYANGSLTGLLSLPAKRYFKLPFTTKETRNSTPLSVLENIDSIIGIDPNPNGAAYNSIRQYRRSLPEVISGTQVPDPVASRPVAANEADPIQLIPKIVTNSMMWDWAKAGPNANDGDATNALDDPPGLKDCTAANAPCNFRSRAAHTTQNELAQWCFGIHKLLVDRVATQIMYMLDYYEIYFGLAAYSNWPRPILPLPLQTMRGRTEARWTGKTPLQYELLGPPPGNYGPVAVPDLIRDQFGAGTAAPLTRGYAADFLQAMSICTRELSHVANPNYPSPPNRYFAPISNAYKPNMAILGTFTDPTSDNLDTSDCESTDPLFGSSPSIEGYFQDGGGSYNFGYNNVGHCEPGHNPSSCTIVSCPSGLSAPPAYSSGEFCSTSYPYYAGVPTGIIDAPHSLPIDKFAFPYRWCLSDESKWPLAHTALAADRAGAFSKSGYPLHLGNAGPSYVASGAVGRYFTNVSQPNVYPETTDVVDSSGEAKDAGLPLALWSTLKTFANGEGTYFTSASKTNRVIILVLAAAPNLGLREVLAGKGQGAFFDVTPTLAQLPAFNDVTVTTPSLASKPYPAAVRETLHMIHTAASLGIKVLLVVVNGNHLGNQDLEDGLLAGLKTPLAVGGSAGAPTFNFCKDGGTTVVLDNEPNVPASTPPCNPAVDADAKNISHISIVRNTGEDYGEYSERVFGEVTRFIRDFVLGYRQKF